MGTWDDTFWDYSNLTQSQEHFAAALKPEWRSVYEILGQVKQDLKSGRSGKSVCLKLVILDVAEIDKARSDGVFIRRGVKWDEWYKRSIMPDLQLLKHGTSIEEIIEQTL